MDRFAEPPKQTWNKVPGLDLQQYYSVEQPSQNGCVSSYVKHPWGKVTGSIGLSTVIGLVDLRGVGECLEGGIDLGTS